MQCFWKSWCKMSPQLILNDVRSTFYLLVTNWNGACFQSNLMRLRKIIVICSVELFWSHSLRFLLTQSFDLYCLLFVCARFISFFMCTEIECFVFSFQFIYYLRNSIFLKLYIVYQLKTECLCKNNTLQRFFQIILYLVDFFLQWIIFFTFFAFAHQCLDRNFFSCVVFFLRITTFLFT